LIERSNAEEAKVATDHDAEFIAGSKPRYERRKKGVTFERNVGMLEVRTVMGIRWAGIK